MTAPRQPDKTKETKATEQKPPRSQKKHITKERAVISRDPHFDRRCQVDALRRDLGIPETLSTDNYFDFRKKALEFKLEQIIKKAEERLEFSHEKDPKAFLKKMLLQSTLALRALRSRRFTEFHKLQAMNLVKYWEQPRDHFLAKEELARLSTIASHSPSVSVKKRMRTGSSKYKEEQKRVAIDYTQQLLKGVKGTPYVQSSSGMVFAAKDPSYYQAEELSETKHDVGRLAQFYQDIYKMKDIAFNGQVFLSELTYASVVFQRINESDYFIHSAFPHDKWSRPGAPIREQLCFRELENEEDFDLLPKDPFSTEAFTVYPSLQAVMFNHDKPESIWAVYIVYSHYDYTGDVFLSEKASEESPEKKCALDGVYIRSCSMNHRIHNVEPAEGETSIAERKAFFDRYVKDGGRLYRAAGGTQDVTNVSVLSYEAQRTMAHVGIQTEEVEKEGGKATISIIKPENSKLLLGYFKVHHVKKEETVASSSDETLVSTTKKAVV